MTEALTSSKSAATTPFQVPLQPDQLTLHCRLQSSPVPRISANNVPCVGTTARSLEVSSTNRATLRNFLLKETSCNFLVGGGFSVGLPLRQAAREMPLAITMPVLTA